MNKDRFLKTLKIQNIPLSQLKISEYNVRKHSSDVSELAKSMKEDGILQPLVVRPESNGKAHYGIVIGSRRFAAAKEAELDEVPVVVHEVDPNDAVRISLVENLQRNDLDPKETVEGLRILIEDGKISTYDLAEQIGKAQSYVASMYGINQLLITFEKHNLRTSLYPELKKRQLGKEIPVQHVIYLSSGIRGAEKKLGQKIPEDKQVELGRKVSALTQTTTENVAKYLKERPDLDVDTLIDDVLQAEASAKGGVGGGRSSGSNRTELTKMGDVRDACLALWKALTDKEFMPHKDEDLTVDHIKPTREFRQFIHGLTKDNRNGLHDWLSYTEAAINDMLGMIEELDG